MADFLATLHDVNLTGLADGGAIYWDATAKQWKSAGGPYTPVFYDAAGVPTLFSNGSFAGRYSKFGEQVNGEAIVIVAATGAFTTGHWYVDLPAAVGSAGQLVGQWCQLVSGVVSGVGIVVNAAVGTTKAELLSSSGAALTGTPTANATLSVQFGYLANA